MNRRELITGGAVAAVAAVSGIGAVAAAMPTAIPAPEHSLIADEMWKEAQVHSVTFENGEIQMKRVGERRIFFVDTHDLPPEQVKALLSKAMSRVSPKIA